MKREMNGLYGTEWQSSDVLSRFYSDSIKGAGYKIREVRKWLNDYEGYGAYYIDKIFNQIYFESDEDMSVFILRWS